MDRIDMPTWLRDLTAGKIPFRQQRQPWYRRYANEVPAWAPAALMAPLILFGLLKGLGRLRRDKTETL